MTLLSIIDTFNNRLTITTFCSTGTYATPCRDDKTAQTAQVTESETLDVGVIVSQVSAIGICSSKGSGSGTPDANKNHTYLYPEI